MGNQWSATSFSTPTDNISPEEEEPPDEPPGGSPTLKMTIYEVKNFDLFPSPSSQDKMVVHQNCKLHTVIRVTSTFSARIYTKPVKCQDFCDNSKILTCNPLLCGTKITNPEICENGKIKSNHIFCAKSFEHCDTKIITTTLPELCENGKSNNYEFCEKDEKSSIPGSPNHELCEKKKKKSSNFELCDIKKKTNPELCDKKSSNSEFCVKKSSNPELFEKRSSNYEICEIKISNPELGDKKSSNFELCDKKSSNPELFEKRSSNPDLCDIKRSNSDFCDKKVQILIFAIKKVQFRNFSKKEFRNFVI